MATCPVKLRFSRHKGCFHIASTSAMKADSFLRGTRSLSFLIIKHSIRFVSMATPHKFADDVQKTEVNVNAKIIYCFHLLSVCTAKHAPPNRATKCALRFCFQLHKILCKKFYVLIKLLKRQL